MHKYVQCVIIRAVHAPESTWPRPDDFIKIASRQIESLRIRHRVRTRQTRGTTQGPTPTIVGIGASAGGLEAFRAFFTHMPDDSDLAFVLVQHLAPDHKSMLSELLGRCTDMPVVEASDGARPQAGHVYVIPPDATLTVADGLLKVHKPAPPREHRRPINTFFTALAEDQGEDAVCIVLSGTGTDGAEGLQAIKNNGGFVLAQAAFDHEAKPGMPASAVATGLVDAVLPVEDMPRRLLAYQKQKHKAASHKGSDGLRTDVGSQLQTICELLLAETGHDFSQYKRKTLTRRIQRRMLVTQTANAEQYVEYLRDHPREHDLLFHECLIGVTEFFRDPAAFEVLETIAIPAMLANKTGADTLRVWVPGCATGEEAYSIAIALREVMGTQQAPKVQIFATDIDDRAIAAARAGRFRGPIKGVSDERLERWFSKDQDDYRVTKQIREMCIFSPHSVVKDPPFSRMDLVSCRNLLIYLNADLQDRLVQSFHYALRPGGFLLLGTSERLSHNERLFTEVDKKQRLYARSEDHHTHPRNFPAAQTRPVDAHEHAAPAPPRDTDDASLDQKARHALDAWSPAYVVVNAAHDVVLFGGDTGRYLAPSAGAASLNLFQLLGKPLRGVVRAAVLQAFASGDEVVRDDVMFTFHGNPRPLRLVVKPMSEYNGNTQRCVVAFDRIDYAPQPPAPETAQGKPGDESSRIQALENELRSTRAQLHTAIDLHETANEELKSANEEYQSVNEELQSSNEELETSTEEMQSINEELQTVNTELNAKNEALTRVNSDIRNLLESTRIATVFLDKSLLIRNYTPAMTELFHLRDGDKGRPITEISPLIDYPQLADDVERVLRELSVSERVLRSYDEGPVYLLRMRPYVTVDNVVDGVVLTFVDVTESRHLNTEHARLAAIVNSSRDAIFGFSLNDRITSWNPSAERIFGLSPEQVIGNRLQMLRPAEVSTDAETFFESHKRAHRMPEFEMTWVRPDGGTVPLEINYSPVRDDDGTLIAGKIIARDITERYQSERHMEMMLGELSHRVKNTLASVQAIALQTLASTQSLPQFRKAFIARLLALSNTHNLLASDAWKGARLSEIINSELAPYQHDGQRVTLHGDKLKLDSKAALALGMAIHELATNAGKYGALSVAEGQVEVAWKTRESRGHTWLHMVWTESDGPRVKKPTRHGFGTRLITDGIVYELGGEVKLEYPATGVTCTFDVPLGKAGDQS
ncbi:MAG TPA: chemotaxis protein CheB [Oleiagrimonas sp.]|nr:chemotaxis protein CheB [Oleiagrimonas sp.]